MLRQIGLMMSTGTILRYRLKPIIFVIRNKGFTIERYVHGWEAAYNDIKSWNFAELPNAFDAHDAADTYSVKTPAELEEVMRRSQITTPVKLQVHLRATKLRF